MVRQRPGRPPARNTGQGSERQVDHAIRKPEATPWGWPGNKHNSERHAHLIGEEVSGAAHTLKDRVNGFNHGHSDSAGDKHQTHVGWPYREEKFKFAGTDYKVSRKPKVKKMNMSGVEKPWGW